MFRHKYDHDDVFLRALTLGLLDLLSNKIKTWHRNDEKDYKIIDIPFYYDMTGDERFMQDIYFGDTLDDCKPYKVVEGNVDIIPRGHIRLTSVNINVSALTNRFVRGEYIKEDDEGNIVTHNAPIQYIPLNVTFECKIYIDGQLNAFKIVQRMIETCYKAHAFKFLFGGFPCEASVGFPEDGGLNQTFEHSYGDDTQKTIEFTLESETYLPVIDPTRDFLKSQRIETFSAPIQVTRITEGSNPVYDDNTIYNNPKHQNTNVTYIPPDSDSTTGV